ncbi:MAG: LysM peptidoglycan-binding domain-containing protein [Anaerolineae bacterium]|nr:LysM peptidoglycan-binding domain-containing protein [Anaerolineae bacterium]
MNEPRYTQNYDDDDYLDYRQRGLTSLGLPPGQLALIIGVNAVISLVISIAVVLIASRQALPGDVATPLTGATPTANPASAGSAEAAQPGPTETSPPPRPTTYSVQAGDTLSAIADRFGVPLADLMTANGLTNQDFIQIGQQLTIPVSGASLPTPTFTAVPVPTDTPLPFDPPTPLPADAAVPPEPAATVGPSPTSTSTASPTLRGPTPTVLPTFTPPPFDEIKVVVSEIIGAGDLFQETLVILNQGAGTSLKNWKLEGSPLGVVTFPDIFLFSGGSIRIHTIAGENTASDLYLNQGEAAWPPGTTIILSNASNAEISRFTVPAASSP